VRDAFVLDTLVSIDGMVIVPSHSSRVDRYAAIRRRGRNDA